MEKDLHADIVPFHSRAIGCVNPKAHDAGKECSIAWIPNPSLARCEACNGDGTMSVFGRDIPCFACGGTTEHDPAAMAYAKDKQWL